MIYKIYCDESRQSKDRYMVLGGIVIPEENIKSFLETMNKYRTEQKMSAELKWSKVSNQKIEEYKRFVEYFFALNNTNNLHFHCIIIDNHQLNHKKYNNGDYELGFYKMYYQLLLHCFGKKYATNSNEIKFITHLDYRTTKYKLDTLKTILNRGLNKKASISSNPFVSIEPINSKLSDVLQINDIIIGAIGYEKNGYPLIAESKQSKIDLVKYIAKMAGVQDISTNTPKPNSRFTIWNFQLKA